MAGRKELRRPPGSRKRGPWVLEVELGSGLWSLFILLNASVLSAAVSHRLVLPPPHSTPVLTRSAWPEDQGTPTPSQAAASTCPMALCQLHMQFLCLQTSVHVFPLLEFPAPLQASTKWNGMLGVWPQVSPLSSGQVPCLWTPRCHPWTVLCCAVLPYSWPQAQGGTWGVS